MPLDIGRVTTVYTEDGIVLLNVQLDRKGVEEIGVPVIKSHPGVLFSPSEGDMVAMDRLHDGTPIALGVISKAEYPQKEIGSHEFVIELDEESKIEVEKDEETEAFNINLDFEGDVSINGGSVAVSGESVTVDSEDIELSGSKPVVTDITTSSSDGYLTSLNLILSEDVTVN